MKTKLFSLALLALGLILSPALLGATNPSGTYTPLKIYQTVDPIFPRQILQTRLEGEAKIAISVNAEGKLVDHLVIGYSHKPFADSAVEAIKDWRFDPARLNGEPIPAVTELTISFAATGVVVSLNFQEAVEQFYRGLHRPGYEYELCTFRQIDRIPNPLSVVAPIYPAQLTKKGIAGSVRITFFIDETGSVRLPAILEADDYVLAEFAVDAIRKWKFEPPTRRGEPVLVKAMQVFNFTPKAPVAQPTM